MSIFSCKDNAGPMSDSLDRDPPLGQWLTLRGHLLMCSSCRRLHRCWLFLRAAAHGLEDQAKREDVSCASLSPEARHRIKVSLEQNNS